jgi:NAD(P)-dependent dehydrogenase (short-subunit alcohol dehydrogenase family)
MKVPDLDGRVVLITGASRGIGAGLARRFAGTGCRLHILADDDAVMPLAAELGAQGHLCDITNSDRVRQTVGGIGPIHVLVNNAGLERLTPVADPSPETEAVFRRIIEINVIGTYLVTRAALQAMQPGARIINTASIWGRTGVADFAAYVASKHAVIGFTRSLAKELGPRGIAVNAVCPGWVRTEASLRSLNLMAARAMRSEQDVLDEILAAQAMPGLMEPDDIAGMYLFLASDLARNVTGQSIGIDRGEFVS